MGDSRQANRASVLPKFKYSTGSPWEGRRCTLKAWPLTFVLLGTGDTGQLGVQLIFLRDLQNTGSVVNHHSEEVRTAGDLKDVLDIREVV